jgi:hypothetical protein
MPECVCSTAACPVPGRVLYKVICAAGLDVSVTTAACPVLAPDVSLIKQELSIEYRQYIARAAPARDLYVCFCAAPGGCLPAKVYASPVRVLL